MSPEAREAAKEGRGDGGKGRSQADMTALELALLNTEYAAIYNNTLDALREAETAAERALTKAEAALDEARDALNDILDRAATLEDGTRVFRDPDTGTVFTEDGERVDPEIAEAIEWRGDEPGYGTYSEIREAFERAEETVREIRSYQVQLGGYRGDLEDGRHAETPDEMKDIGAHISEDMPDAVRKEWDQMQPAETSPASQISAAAFPDMEV